MSERTPLGGRQSLGPINRRPGGVGNSLCAPPQGFPYFFGGA